jgi:hypothetical protein
MFLQGFDGNLTVRCVGQQCGGNSLYLAARLLALKE